ncbi:MAG TPA: hypothetical protein ACN46L_06330, partial [Prochlorococcus sp.]
VSRQKRSILYLDDTQISFIAGCSDPICTNAHGLPYNILYCLRVGSAAEGLPPAPQTAFFNLDKTTAIREAELLRLEASLAATARDEHALAYGQHPHSNNRTGLAPASPSSNFDRN